MTLAELVDAAVDSGAYIVCSMSVYRAVRDRVRERERVINDESILAGRGATLMQPIGIYPSPWQRSPEVVLFFSDNELRNHLELLSEPADGGGLYAESCKPSRS